MKPLVEWSQHQPPFQISKNISARGAVDQLLEQGRVIPPEPPPLGGDPVVESRAAIDLQPIEKVPGEQCLERPQPVGRSSAKALNRISNLDNVDEAACQIQGDAVGRGIDPSPVRFIDKAPDLAETPTKLAPRIIRHLP